jgi:hypothetical protein
VCTVIKNRVLLAKSEAMEFHGIQPYYTIIIHPTSYDFK